MRRKYFTILSIFLYITAWSQQSSTGISRPKLVVGIVVDQMRWDFLYRYAGRYGSNGFKRLLREGFSCENTMIPYTPTVTACGHTCIYTGSVPAVHGIVGNNWYASDLQKAMYCTEDTAMTTIGNTSKAGQMSPHYLLASTIGDELKLATNFKSKTIGIALKDRGAILPAGHTADAAYWYDGSTGAFISSSYYMKSLPAWVKAFNEKRLPAAYLSRPWTTLYPPDTYTQSTADVKTHEGLYPGEQQSSFPHQLKAATDSSYAGIAASPFGNTLTLQFARQVIEGYHLGAAGTDMLCVSLSSTDYVGHQFGPHSIETEDTYLRLDKDLGDFFDYLDKSFGRNNYLLFLSADHGAAEAPGFLKEAGLPGGSFNETALVAGVNGAVQQRFGISKIIAGTDNYQLYLNEPAITAAGKNKDSIKNYIIAFLNNKPEIAFAADLSRLNEETIAEPLKTMLTNGFNRKRSGDIQYILQPGWLSGYSKSGTGHGVWLPYDAHIPLVWMGWGISGGSTNETTSMADIAPTLAALLHIQMPGGCTGKPITAIFEKKNH